MPVRFPKSNFFILSINSMFQDSPKRKLTFLYTKMHFRLSPLVKLPLISVHRSLMYPQIWKKHHDSYKHAPHLITLSSLSVSIWFCEPVCTRMTQQCGDTCCILAAHSSINFRMLWREPSLTDSGSQVSFCQRHVLVEWF